MRNLFRGLRNRTWTPYLLWVLPLAFLGVFYFYPLGNIVQLSFRRGGENALRSFWNALTTPTVRDVLGFTLWQASLSTLLTLLVGLPGAYVFARYRFRGKKFLRALFGVPFVMPTLVVAAGFNALLGPNGWVNTLLMNAFQLSSPPIRFLNSFTAILVAHVFYNTTIVLRLVGDFWSRLDPRFSQASQVLGGNRWQTLRQVTIPLLAPAVTAAALLVFIFDFTSFGVILVLGGPQFATLEVEIYYQTISLFNLPMAATLSLLQLGMTLLLTVAYTRVMKVVSRPVRQRGKRGTQQPLTSTAQKIGAGLLILFLGLILTSPLIALAARSITHLRPSQGGRAGITLAFFKALSQNPQESLFYVPPTTAIGVSFAYAIATVTLALLLGLPAAWALTRERDSTLNKLLDPILMLPLGTSAVTLGLGFIVALDQPPLDLRASPILIPLAHTLVAFPFVVRSLTPALQSIQPNLHQAAAVLGASPRQVFRHIDLPMIGRALLVAATFAFTISMGEFGASSLIVRPEYPTVPVVIYRLLSRPGALHYGQAMALSTILMSVTLGGMLAIERFRIADIGEF